MKLLTPMANNPKTAKALAEHGVEGAILHLLASNQAHAALGMRGGTVCPMAERNGCASACLVNQGRGRMRTVYAARLERTRMYLQDRDAFLSQLQDELGALKRRADRKGLRAVARLDGTSDLGLALGLAPFFPGIMFYDYTKVAARAERVARAQDAGARVWGNLHITFSRGAGNEADSLRLLHRGINVTVVFRIPARAKVKHTLPMFWRGFPVIDGDAHDLRYLDPVKWHGKGVVVGLRAKGSAIHDRTGFVVDPE